MRVTGQALRGLSKPMPRTETTTVRCDRCRTTTAIIEYVPSAGFLDEISEKLRALGWRVAGGEVCGECVRAEEKARRRTK